MRSGIFLFFVVAVIHLYGRMLDSQFVAQALKGVDARIELIVVDEMGIPVPEVLVMASFSRLASKVSMQCKSDLNGKCILEHKTCGNSIELAVSKPGYYRSSKKLCLIKMGKEHEIINGHWQPYPLLEKIVIKQQHFPVKATTHGGVYDIPTTNAWCAFDLGCNDWVMPSGKGTTADIEFKYSWEGDEPMRWKSQNLEMRFVGNPCNGKYLIHAQQHSEFPYSYSADPNGRYSSELRDTLNSDSRKFGVLDGSQDLVFRFRCITNEVGKIVSCNYGRFRRLDYGLERTGRGSLLMQYDYNGSSNDTNLEFTKK